MHDAAAVERGERPEDGEGDLERLSKRQPLALDPIGE